MFVYLIRQACNNMQILIPESLALIFRQKVSLISLVIALLFGPSRQVFCRQKQHTSWVQNF